MTVQTEQSGEPVSEEEFVCETPHKKVTVAVISSNVMGNGDDGSGKDSDQRIYLCTVPVRDSA